MIAYVVVNPTIIRLQPRRPLALYYVWLIKKASEWLSFNAKRVFFQPDYDENKLHSAEMMMMMSALYYSVDMLKLDFHSASPL